VHGLFAETRAQMVDAVLLAAQELLSILDDAKENVDGGLHLRLCNAAQVVYSKAEALKAEHQGDDNDGDELAQEFDEESEEESDEESEKERTEDDMELNELSELWECQFDFGRWNAVRPLEDLIETIVEDFEPKRVCAAVRVLNRAVKGSKPDDPEDAERILQWKEELVEQRAIEECARILEGDRGFQNSDDDPWMYSVICDEILELFQRLGEGDALFRTKLRRNGALKALKKYQGRSHLRETVLEMLLR
jgi:hypothetical protein